VNAPITRQYLIDIFDHFRQQNIKIVRLDAIAYVTKKAGTNCFFVEPEIYEIMAWIKGVANGMGIALLPEVHAHYRIQFALAQHGYWVYDFVLPLLVLHTLLTQSGQKLQDYLKICPRQQFTTLDCHDGIPVQPDLDDILTIAESQKVVDICLQRGANLNRILSTERRQADFDAHQINCTYYSALGENDEAYLAARAIQFFAPGVPQVYYVGLLAGENDDESVERTGEGRAINRHNYRADEIDQALQKPVVQRLLKLIEFRDTHEAFNGDFSVSDTDGNHLQLVWQKDDQICQLNMNLTNYESIIEYTTENGDWVTYRV